MRLCIENLAILFIIAVILLGGCRQKTVLQEPANSDPIAPESNIGTQNKISSSDDNIVKTIEARTSSGKKITLTLTRPYPKLPSDIYERLK